MPKRTLTPLTPAVLHILLALFTEERHGYGIMKQVERESRGKVKMGPGTLYGSLGRMMAAGLIREGDRRVDPAMDDERRIYYALTGIGQQALAAELDRYQEVVAVATDKRLTRNAVARGACTMVCSITQLGSTRSINAGVASGIAMHTWVRQHADLSRAW